MMTPANRMARYWAAARCAPGAPELTSLFADDLEFARNLYKTGHRTPKLDAYLENMLANYHRCELAAQRQREAEGHRESESSRDAN